MAKTPLKTPLSNVKDQFGEKTKLVAELEKFTKDGDLWLGRTNADKGLKHVSNTKLLRLHKTFTEVKAKFGTRAKLIDAILEVEKRTKDEGYKRRMEAYPVPRLWDLYKSASKRNAPKAAKPAGDKKATSAKAAPAKAAAPAKKAPAKTGKAKKS